MPDRAGMTIFFAPAAEKLGALRTAEDLFGLAGYRAGIGPENEALDKIRARGARSAAGRGGAGGARQSLAGDARGPQAQVPRDRQDGR